MMDERLDKLKAISTTPVSQPPETAIDSSEDSRLSKLNRISTLKKKDISESSEPTLQSSGEVPENAQFGSTVKFPALAPRQQEKAVKIFNTHFPVGIGVKNAKPPSAVAEMGKSLGQPDEFLGDIREKGMYDWKKEPVREALKIEPQKEDVGVGAIDTSKALIEPTRPQKNPTVRDYINEYGVTAESLGLSPEFNLDRNISPDDISRFNAILENRKDIQKKHDVWSEEELRAQTSWGSNGSLAGQAADAILGYVKNVNIGTAGLFRQLNGAEKILGAMMWTGHTGIFGKIANYIEDNAVNGLPDLPKDMVSSVVGQLGQMNAFFLQMATPLPVGIPKLPLILATGGALSKADELKDVNSFKSKMKIVGAFTEGAITGKVFEYFGKGGANISKRIEGSKGMGRLELKELPGGENSLTYVIPKQTKIISQLANTVVNSTGFAGTIALEQQLALKEPDYQKIGGGALLGATLSAPQMAQLVWGGAVTKALEWRYRDPKAYEGSNRGKSTDRAYPDIPDIDPQKSFQVLDKIEGLIEKNPGNQELIKAREVVSNTILLDAGMKMIATNPNVALQVINNSDLTPTEKQIYIDRVNQIAADYDPRIDVAKPIINQADEITAKIAFIQNNPSVPQTIKDAQIKGLQSQANDLMKKASNILNEPLVVSERPGEEVSAINTKKGDFVITAAGERVEVVGFTKTRSGGEGIEVKVKSEVSEQDMRDEAENTVWKRSGKEFHPKGNTADFRKDFSSEIESEYQRIKGVWASSSGMTSIMPLSDVSKPLTVAGKTTDVKPETIQEDGKTKEGQGRKEVLTPEESEQMVKEAGLPPLPPIEGLVSEIVSSKSNEYEYKDNQEGRGILSSDGGRKVVDPANVIGEGETTQNGDRLIPADEGKVGVGAIYNQKGYKIIGIDGTKLKLAGNGETIEVEKDKVSVLTEKTTEKLTDVIDKDVSTIDFKDIPWNEFTDEVKYRANMVNVEVAPNETMAISADAMEMMSNPENKGKTAGDVMYEAVEKYRQWRQRGGKIEPVVPEISKTADGSQYSRPNVSYNEAVRNNAKDGNLNLWVRRDIGETNGDRHLLIQFSSDMLNGGRRPVDPITEQYDKMYRLRPGYDRTFDFWEVPLWVPRLASQLPKSDFYVIRDMGEAIKFLDSAKYGEISFSVLDINEKFVAEIATALPGQKIAVGGYTEFTKLQGKNNVKTYKTVESFLEDHGLPNKHSYSYQHFFGTKAIPRLRMSTGCLYKCAFCSPAIERVIKEVPWEVIEEQVNSLSHLDATLVYMDDKTFIQAKNYKRLPEIYKTIKESNPDFEGFIIQTTASDMLKFDDQYLADAHIVYVELGIESYNDAILKRLHKPALEKTMDAAVEKLRKNKIKFIPNLVIGFGGFETVNGKEVSWEETPETYQHTLDFLERNADTISHINMNTLALYEGSELGDSIDARIDATENDLNQKEARKSFHKTPEVHVEAVKKFSDFAMKILDFTPYAEKDKYVLVAPYYDMKITDLDQARAIRMSPAYQTYMKNLSAIADIMNMKVEEVNDTVGRYKSLSEVSNRIVVTAPNLQAVSEYAAVIGVMSGETQDSTISAKYLDMKDHPNQTAIEISFKVSNPERVLDVMKEAGIDDAEFNDTTGVVSILDFSNGQDVKKDQEIVNFVTKLHENGIDTEKPSYRPIQSNFIDAETRTELLEGVGRELGLQQGGKGIRDLIDKAISRNEEHKRLHPVYEVTPEKQEIQQEVANVVKVAMAPPVFRPLGLEIKTMLEGLIARAPNALPLEIIDHQSQLPERILEDARSMAGTGPMPRIHAVWDGFLGKIWVVTDNMKSPEHAMAVFFHEEGSHHGLRILIPDPKELNNLLENVFNSAGMKKIIDAVDPSYILAHENGSMSDAALAEEYISKLAQKIEKGTADQVEKGLWQKILDYVRKMLKKWTKKDVPLTDKDIMDIVKASTATLYEPLNANTEIPYDRIMFSMKGFMKGDFNLKKFGIKPGKNYTLRQIYEALEKYYVSKYGQIGKLESTQGLRGEELAKVEAKNDETRYKTIHKLSSWMADEAGYMYETFKDNKDSGIGWYTTEYQKALADYEKEFTEFKENANGERELYTMLIAITSDGTEVYQNEVAADDIYSKYRLSGSLEDTKLGGERNASYNNNLERMRQIIASFDGDVKKTAKWLLELRTGSEIKAIAKEKGWDYSSGWENDVKLPTAVAVFGPKIGVFFSNLMGEDGFPTMDRWESRMFNRMRGIVIPEVKGLASDDEVGLALYKKTIGSPDISNEDALHNVAVRSKQFIKRGGPDGKGTYWTELEQKVGFKEGTDAGEKKVFWDAVDGYAVKKGETLFPEMESDKPKLIQDHHADKAGNTIYKDAFTGVNDAPFSAADRTLQYETFKLAKKKLKDRGINLSIADIQAALWYFEKRLYIKLGGKKAAIGISYGDVSAQILQDYKETGKFVNEATAKRFKEIELDSKNMDQVQNQIQFSMEQSNPFRSENEKPIGFEYDTERLARDRFDIPKLQEIGKGSDRTVFDLGGDRALKVAHTPRGMAQNIHEGSWDLQSEGITPEYYERGINYIISQKAEPSGNYAQARIDPLYKKGNDKLNDIIDDLYDFTQEDFDNRKHELQEVLRKHGLDYIMNYPIIFSDFKSARNWGIINGKPVHIDGGTFGGVKLLEDYRGLSNMKDVEFMELAKKNKALKQKYGDTDKYTMFSAEGISEENKKAIVDAIIQGAGKWAALSPELSIEEITHEYKESLLRNNPEIPESLINEALGIEPNVALGDQFQTSLKNSVVEDEIILRAGQTRLEELKSEVNRELKTDMDEVFDMAKSGIDRGSIDPDEVSKRIIQTGTGSDMDEAVLLIKRAQFRAERITLINEQANAKTKEEMYAIDSAIKQLNESQINNDLAGMIMGRMASNIFRLRQRFVNEEYDLLQQIREYRDLNRGEIEPEVEAKFRDLSDKLIKAEARIAELEKERETKEVNEGLSEIKSRKVYGPRNKVSDGLKSMADALKIPKDQRPKFSLEEERSVMFSAESKDPVFNALQKIGKGLIDEGTANLKTVASKTKEIVEKNFPGQVDVDNYATALNEAMAQHVGKPSVTDGKVKIPGKFIKDIVSQGFTNIEDVVSLTKEAIGDDSVGDRDIRDAITKYVKEESKPLSKLQQQINEMERVGRFISEYEDIINEHKLKESKGKPHPITSREENLKGKIKQAKKDFGLRTPAEQVRENAKLDRLNQQLQDLKQGIIPQSTPATPRQLSIEEARLRMEILDEKENLRENAKINELQKKLQDIQNGVTYTPKTHTPAQRSSAVNSLLDQIDKAKKQSAEQVRIDKLQKQLDDIKKGIIHPKVTPTPKQISDAEKQLKAEIQAEKKLIYDSESEVLKRHKESLRRSIDRYKERINNKDYGPPKKPAPVLDNEAMRLEIEKQDIKYQFEKEKEKARLKNRKLGEKVLDMSVDALSIPKSLMASGDLSYLLRQGVILSSGHPMIAGRAFVESLKMFAREENETKWMAALRASDIFPILKKAGLDLSDPHAKLAAREEMFLSNLANKIPFWGDTQRFKVKGKNVMVPGLGVVSRSSRAYTGFLNKMRVDVFASVYDDLISRGYDFNRDIEAFKAWAELINCSTGRGDLGKLEQVAPYLNLFFFAPKLVVSRFAILFGLPRHLANQAYEMMPDQMFGKSKPKLPPILNDNLDPLIRKAHLRNVLSFIGLASLVLVLLDLSDVAEVELDPRSSDFGKAIIGNLRIDVWAGFQQIVRTIVQFITGERKSATTGNIVKFDPKEFPYSSRADVLGGFIRNKLSPAASFAIDAMTGKNAVGETFVLENEPADNAVPLYLQDMKDIYQTEGLGMAVGAAIPGLLGAGTQYYIPNPTPQPYHWVKTKFGMKFQRNPEFWKARLPERVDSRVGDLK